MDFSPKVEARARALCKDLALNEEREIEVVAAGIKAIVEAFKVEPDDVVLDDVFFDDIKPPGLREVDGMEMVLSVEESVGRFLNSDSGELLMKIYLVSVREWLMQLRNAKWE